jgi:hypothetical protein
MGSTGPESHSGDDFTSLVGRVRDLESRLSTQTSLPFITSQGILQQRLATAAVTSAQQNAISNTAFAAGESLEDTLTTTFAGNFGAAPTLVARTTDLRPDPTVGSVYRWSAGGTWTNSGGGARTFSAGINFVNNSVLEPFVVALAVPNGGTIIFWSFIATLVVNLAGVSGKMTFTGMGMEGTGIVSVPGGTGSFDPVSDVAVNMNLVGERVQSVCTCSVIDAGCSTRVNSVVVETLGFRQG